MQTLLSPSTHYYIRRLLVQNLDRIEPGAVLESPADAFSDLNIVLEGLYLEAVMLCDAIKQLEQLTLLHGTLSNQGKKHHLKLQQTEVQIFGLLGLKLNVPSLQGSILIVDDTPLHLRLLSVALGQHNYAVITENTSSSVLKTAQYYLLDLIFLDIMMPIVDGYQLCERLKADAVTRDIPVIFISSIGTALDKVKAFEVGGSDYITKPFQIEEVLARIDHQLNIRRLRKRLEEQNIRLQQDAQAQRHGENLYRNLFDQAVDGMFQTTADGHFLRVNAALARLYGYDSPDELMSTINNIALTILP